MSKPNAEGGSQRRVNGTTSHVEELASHHDIEESSPLVSQLDDVATFAQTYNLTSHLDVFQKAAAVIQADVTVTDIPKITQHEIKALENETTRKWRQPTTMYMTILLTALGAMGQGWAQTSMNGANLYFPEAFGIGSRSARDNLIVGLINSGIYLSNGLLGAWLVTPINDKFGRKGAVFGATVLSCLSNIGGALTSNWQQLLFFRLVLGCALGVISSTLNIYAAECAPAVIRGGLAVSWQMFCAFGIFTGFVFNVAVYDVSHNANRRNCH